MSSDNILIRAHNLGKCYQLYEKPHHRLLQTLFHGRKQFFREFWALRGVSLELRRGESIGVLGRNGAGKSTLLQMLSGVLAPTLGSLEINGRVAALLELGSGFNPEFTGRENAYLNGAILGLGKKEMDGRMEAIEEFADVGSFFDQPVKLYSSGMMLRVAFAVQVQVEPDILIVDEALSVGDALFQKRCYDRLDKLLENGTSLFLVSHDTEAVRTFTQKALILKGGKVVNQGSSADMVLEYRNLLHEEERKLTATVPHGPDRKDVRPAKSYGTGEATMLEVALFKNGSIKTDTFVSGEEITIRLRFVCHKDLSHISVGVRIRNRLGHKIYSWGTLNQDMARRAASGHEPLFWDKSFRQGDIGEVTLSCQCSLGADLYEIQTYITHEGTCDYKNQLMLEWKDEAAFFNVLPSPDNYFGGLIDLRMRAEWEKK